MIHTNFNALHNKSNYYNWQVSFATKNTRTKDMTGKNITHKVNNTGVVLTLSSEGRERQAKLRAMDAQAATTNRSAATAHAATASSTVLKYGSRGSEVTQLQRDLTTLGYDTKGIDGSFGNDTKNAVMEFQRAYGLSVDGVVGPGTKSAIAKALDYHNKGILAQGSRGAAVTELQRNLNKLGYNTNGVDGIFGAGTKNAVIAFQRANGLTQDGIVGNSTKNAINNALNAINNPQPPQQNTPSVQRILNNLRNDTSLGLSAEKKEAMVKAAGRLLNENYEVEFVAGVLGNIQNEGTPGKFESSNYSNEAKKPAYLKYMDSHFDYRNKFSGGSIQDVGISAAIDLENKAKASGFQGKFGLGMIQWTGSRTEGLLKSYQKYASSDKPTKSECITAEVNYMVDELKGSYSYVYNSWKSGSKTAYSAGDIVCRKYEVPADTNTQANARGNNATKIYNVMMK